MAITTRKPEKLGVSPGREVLKLTSRLVRRKIAKSLPAPGEALATLTKNLPAPGEALATLSEHVGNGDHDGAPLVRRLRSVPIQISLDIAVPLELAYEQWMTLEFLPEGVHTVRDIRRRGDRLLGRIPGAREPWRAEVREERDGESFAWRSLAGSDCLGLVTFHRLASRLTRLEVELDVIAQGPAEAFELLTHIADRRAETDLRRFKAELERISPDDYPSLVPDAGDEAQSDNDEEE
ncbi:MAG TPA: hypothetical protein VKR21_12320 [Solirubrobacteraceae bacterium]|nr:hypothetical protein [Solirubrobacteraceae bacterium]